MNIAEYNNKVQQLNNQILNIESELRIFKVKFKPFKPNTNSDILNDNFYDEQGIYYLTNGANKWIGYDGGGTTRALDAINGKKHNTGIFDSKKYILLYEPQDNMGYDPKYLELALDGDQVIQRSPRTDLNGKPAGTVLYTTGFDPIKKGEGWIHKVYHINGLHWRIVKDKNDTKLRNSAIPVIKDYYDAIIKDVIMDATQDTDNNYYIHLAKIPGQLYEGGEESITGMMQAVKLNLYGIPSNLTLILDADEKYRPQLTSNNT